MSPTVSVGRGGTRYGESPAQCPLPGPAPSTEQGMGAKPGSGGSPGTAGETDTPLALFPLSR